MFYMQCNECNERWELGTAITCKCSEKEPLEYWNAVEGWVKISELREHFDSVGCGTIYKTSGEGRVALCVAQPEQEPVAWMFEDDEDNGHKTFSQTPPSPEAVAYLEKWNRPAWVPLYTSPPQRTWVGLTDEELQPIGWTTLREILKPNSRRRTYDPR